MFGMSVFQSVLERLKAEQDEAMPDEEIDGLRSAVIGASPSFVVDTPSRATAFYGAVQQAYRELTPDEPPEPHVMPDYLMRTSLAEVASELALGERETALTLTSKRRRFAAANHPDRLPPDFRPNATVRMKLANMLIDEAARRLEVAR